MDVARSAPQGAHYYHADVIHWELRREHGVYGTPSKVYTNSVPDQQSLDPDGQHTHAFYTKCVPPVEHLLKSEVIEAFRSRLSLCARRAFLWL